LGGFVRQYQIELSSARMKASGVTFMEVMAAIGAANLNVGGRTVEENGQEFVIRGIGLLRGLDDLRQIVVTAREAGVVTLGTLGEIRLGGEPRRGALDVDGQEVVGGIVVMSAGGNASHTVAAVKQRLAELAPGLNALAPGVSVRAFYDRTHLIDRTVSALRHALIVEVLLVAGVHLLFLLHWRSVAVVILPLPVSVAISFVLMQGAGVSANVMSLAGLAIAIGVLVDASIVTSEAVVRDSEARQAETGRPLRGAEQRRIARTAILRVARPMFFASAIVLVAFVPVFGLTGQEGKLFHPLAFAKTFVMAVSTVLGVTLVPVLCAGFIRGPYSSEARHPVLAMCLRLYTPVLDAVLRRPHRVVAAAGLLLAVSVFAARGLGSEFMPTPNEGHLLMMPVLLPGTAFSEVQKVVAWQDATLKEVPEVVRATGKLGRADTATDPAPAQMIETTLELRPESEWRPGLTRDGLIAELTAKLSRLPGYVPGFLQPIEGRILMLDSGVRAQVGVKVFGDNPRALQAKALEIETVLRGVTGAQAVSATRTEARPYVEIEVNRLALAHFGVSAAEVMRAVEVGFGGATAATVLEGRARIPVQVRLQASERSDIERIRDLLVPRSYGGPLPLRVLADVRRVTGSNEILSENGRIYSLVACNFQGRDLDRFTTDAKDTVKRKVALDPGMSLVWTGAHEHERHAEQTLRLVIPTALLIIFGLLLVTYRSVSEATHILLAVPFALSGGLALQSLLGLPFSVAVWVGYIVLFGTAIQTTMVMVLYLDEAVRRASAELGRALTGAELRSAILDGACLRLRPKLMTALTVIASMLAMMLTKEAGADVMHALAVPVLGGMVSSLLHVLILTPALFCLTRLRERA
jgi:Cu(I)/Ag(I) efflux system membrane protein CusA/SilA